LGHIIGQVPGQALPAGVDLDGDEEGEDLSPGEVKHGVVTYGGEPPVVAERQLELGAGLLNSGVGVIEHLPDIVLEEGGRLTVQAREGPEQSVYLLIAQGVASQRVGGPVPPQPGREGGPHQQSVGETRPGPAQLHRSPQDATEGVWHTRP
jgi:hypothetical protein